MPKRARDPDASIDVDARPTKQKRTASPIPGPYKPKPAPQKSWVPQQRETHKIVRLAPSKPYPSVPGGRSATSSRRAQHLNHFLVSRRSTLGQYLRRCKAVFLESNKKSIYLTAMGAAIPMLLQIASSLPHILPYDRSKIAIEVKTGTQRVNDELVPLDENEDIQLRSRDKSTLHVIVKVDGGDPEPVESTGRRRRKKKNKYRKDDSDEEAETVEADEDDVDDIMQE